jgi:nucleoside 2-deoxyribosyltransferase
MKIYIAGPDVFRPDAAAWAEAVRAQCLAAGAEALIPLDGDATTADGIYASNVAMIRAADAVIANLNPFRGAEPDSGTCFEVGFALALEKPVFGFVADSRPLRERVEKWQGAALCPHGDRLLDAQGWCVENFDLPVNLMLAVPVSLSGDFSAALARAVSGRD